MAINVQNESELHRQLKEYLCGSSYEMEKPVKGYVADLWSSDMIREIQTGNFPSLAAKLRALLPEYAVEVCFPVVERKTILVVDQDGALVSRRRSPKKGCACDVFSELVYLKDLPAHPHFNLRLIGVAVEEVRRQDGQGSWRRKGQSIAARNLLEVLWEQPFRFPEDYIALLPDLETFTTAGVRVSAGCSASVARKICYVLCQNGLIVREGKAGRSYLYRKTDGAIIAEDTP